MVMILNRVGRARKRGAPRPVAGKPKVQKVQKREVGNQNGPPEEGQPSLWAGEVWVRGGICQPFSVTKNTGTEGCWENLVFGSTLIC